MKIRLSRRRLKAFFAKWGGLVLAAALVLPTAVVGGTYLYASSRVEDTTVWVTQAIALTGFEAAGRTPGTASSITYHISVSIDNSRTSNAAQISITNAKLSLNNLTFDIAGSASWQGSVAGKSILTFEGDIVIGPDEARELWDKDLALRITGIVTANARYAFVSKEEARSVNINGNVTIPSPTISPPAITDEPEGTGYPAS